MFKKVLAAALSFGLIGATISAPVYAQDDDHDGIQGKIKHVLLISVDGFHALDLANYVNTHHDSTLAALSRNGITFTNASTSSIVNMMAGRSKPSRSRYPTPASPSTGTPEMLRSRMSL